MSDTFEFVVSEIDGRYIIGDNTTIPRNGVNNWDNSVFLVIPSIIDEKPIEEIGSHAFYGLVSIEEVVIKEGIKQLNQYCFSRCENLKKITIPSSVEFLGGASIHAYNYTLALINSSYKSKLYTTKGELKVIFLPESNLKYMDQACISRKENIIVYYWGYSEPNHHQDPFSKSYSKVKIYSPYVKKFGGFVVKNRICTCEINAQKYIVIQKPIQLTSIL